MQRVVASVADYRLYFLGIDDRISKAVELDCPDDQAAVAAVAEHADGRAMELWQLGRKVRMFPASADREGT